MNLTVLKAKLKAAKSELRIRQRNKNTSDRAYFKVIKTIEILEKKIELART